MQSNSDSMQTQEKTADYSDGKSQEPEGKLYRIDYEWGNLRYEVHDNNLFLHVTVYEWSPGIYKTMLRQWKHFRTRAKEHGFETLYAIIPENDFILKFDKMFGMEEYGRENGHILMRREL